MFVVRKYEERDVPDCAKCFYESFFDCPLTEKDKIFLRDYAQVLIEKCSFTYVAESEGVRFHTSRRAKDRSSGLLSGITKRVSTNRLPKRTTQNRTTRRG